jgi:DivIVA domain-containing protein
MALTPEDVVNKRFQPTKFREGYDQDEVDDFLDEVVVELRRLNQENEELRQRLVASDSRINELQRSGGAQAAQPQQQTFTQQPEPVAAPVAAPAFAAAGAGPDANPMDPGNTNNLLQLARRLHEEHVREGVEKRDALIAEGHATAARVVAEAETRQRAQLGSLDQERQQLEYKIEELRNFEREYRQKLKGYIEGQLRELDAPSALTAAPAAAPAQAFAEVAAQPYETQQPSSSFDAQQPSYDAQQPSYESQQYGAPSGTQPPASFPGFSGS